MVVPTRFPLRALLAGCMLSMGLTGWSQRLPENLPEPPPLPPSLKNKQLTLPPDLPDPADLQAQLQQLGELLNMEPEKLHKLRQTIEFIEKMSPGEREAMRIRISQITRATPELSKEINRLSSICPAVEQSDLSQFWLAASAKERSRVRDSLEQLDKDRQAAFIQAKVKSFTDKRDAAFEDMRKSLEKKRQSLPDSTDVGP